VARHKIIVLIETIRDLYSRGLPSKPSGLSRTTDGCFSCLRCNRLRETRKKDTRL
jgi:hypothetical protein